MLIDKSSMTHIECVFPNKVVYDGQVVHETEDNLWLLVDGNVIIVAKSACVVTNAKQG